MNTSLYISLKDFNTILNERNILLGRRAIKSARTALMTDFVPRILGFQPITREDVIQRHTRQLSKDLMSSLVLQKTKQYWSWVEGMCTRVLTFLLPGDQIFYTNIDYY